MFNVLLITRAPLQLFQAIQTSLLPHLSGLHATGGGDDFARAIRTTVAGDRRLRRARSCSASALIGPWAMGVLFGGDFDYARGGLVLVGLGMGFHLTAGTLNQAALARRPRRRWRPPPGWPRPRCSCSGCCRSPLDDQVLAVEVGYCATTALLAVALWLIERTSASAP